ncbi:MAG: TRAP transporter small permease [Phycisphaeraceae bacterium]
MTAAVLAVRRALLGGLKWVVIVLMALLVIDVLWQVFTRYVAWRSTWTQSLAEYLLVWVSLLGACVVYAERGHLGVDYFVSKLPSLAQQVIEVLINLVVGAFSIFVLIIGGSALVGQQWGQRAPELHGVIGLTMGMVYLALPISGVFFVILCLEQIIEVLRGERRKAGADSAEKGTGQVPPAEEKLVESASADANRQ